MHGSVATLTDGHNERQLTQGLPLVVILGATATGKSGLALSVAQALGGEVISCDSRYLYRGMDIGTAKPDPDELALVPHHLIDILDPQDDYSLASYLDDAFAAIEQVGGRGRLPVVAGGTPLYLRALIEGWRVPRVAPDTQLRAELENLPLEALVADLTLVDPVSAQRIDPNNRRRLIRAYEVFQLSGQRLSDLEGKQAPPYHMLILGLYQDRDALYRRIDERVDWMFANGILEEARALVERGVPDTVPAMSAIGYREARSTLQGMLSQAEAIEATRNATHRYVRHQETWFRKFKGVVWLESSSTGFDDEALQQVRAFYANDTGSPLSADF